MWAVEWAAGLAVAVGLAVLLALSPGLAAVSVAALAVALEVALAVVSALGQACANCKLPDFRPERQPRNLAKPVSALTHELRTSSSLLSFHKSECSDGQRFPPCLCDREPGSQGTQLSRRGGGIGGSMGGFETLFR